MLQLVTDLRYAARQLRHNLDFLIPAALTLALGVAIPAAVQGIASSIVSAVTSRLDLRQIDAVSVRDRTSSKEWFIVPARVFRAVQAEPPDGVRGLASVYGVVDR